MGRPLTAGPEGGAPAPAPAGAPAPEPQPGGGGGPVAFSAGDFMWFIGTALDEMVRILRQLGDETANRRPDLSGANSPFAILTHCLGVMEFWGGCMVSGRVIERDREAEFTAVGQVEDLVRRTEAARRQLDLDISRLDSAAVPSGALGPEDAGTPYGRSQGAVLLHVLEELLQHLGQMQLTRDILLAGD